MAQNWLPKKWYIYNYTLYIKDVVYRIMLRFLELMAFVALVPMDINWPPLHAAGCTRSPGQRRLLGSEPENHQRLESGEHGELTNFSLELKKRKSPDSNWNLQLNFFLHFLKFTTRKKVCRCLNSVSLRSRRASHRRGISMCSRFFLQLQPLMENVANSQHCRALNVTN